MRRVVITGIGVVSPIGHGREVYWNALAAGKNGIGPVTLFDTTDFPVRIAAEVRDFDAGLYMDRKEIRRSDRVIHFSVAAAAMAVEDAKLDEGSLDRTRYGVYIGSGEGGISTTNENYRILYEKGPTRISPFFIPMMISNMPAAYVAMVHGAKGPNLSVVTACATATNTIGEAYYAILRDDADVILTGGAEAAIVPIALAGFAAAKTLSTRNDEPEKASRPFDVDRDGFVMGEGAGVLVLEELEHAKNRGARIWGEIVGYGATCDAYHITAPSPDGDGQIRAMAMAVRKAGWRKEDVELINAHGTSTPLNDKTESLAIRTLFGDYTDKLLVNSTKSLVGHGLGAAGALETIAAIQSLVEGIVHPTLNLDSKDPECDVPVVGKEAIHVPIRHVLVNNFGFGGHNGVLALTRFEE
ncbi:MAG TPA: beta-ketoacyl-ACP synthase II [Synergistaceae bacterium]|nr:beta-ketoacyl-ACP synthase II [Synergistaceae bacterium]HQF91874.1 beta-ketoacyl-ACP synthase II [Synergistaceae bacterium]HQH78853.1 beta-ketoacyl-ACP synthase II [Synergistaceae bacterium]HQK25396.1 beta-ketoacyl-ACP synthase II [Synergistaceae bacterium]